MWVWIRNLLTVRDTPEALARGLAVGFFFGVSFFWGLQILLAVLVTFLVRGKKVVAAAMTAVSNPITSLPLYSFCYFVGHLILGGNDNHSDFTLVHSLEGFIALGPHFFITMLIGTTLIGLLGALAIYFSSERLLEALRRWHSRKGGEFRVLSPLVNACSIFPGMLDAQAKNANSSATTMVEDLRQCPLHDQPVH